MNVFLKCPYCEEHFELEEELESHIAEDHFKLSPNPKKEYYAETWLIIKANNPEEVERILDYIVNIKLPKFIDQRILRWSYADETRQPIIEDQTDVDWTH
jgi:hypothetical protein